MTAKSRPSAPPISELVPTNLPFAYSIQPIPSGLNPLTASDDELQKYGFPRRPAAGSAALRAWQRVFARPLRQHVVPILELHTELTHKPSPPRPKGTDTTPQSLFGETLNWSGAMATTSNWDQNPYTGVYAQWTVPAAST
jgi:hypothetical protein